MTNALDTLKALKNELETQLNQVNAAIACFGGPTAPIASAKNPLASLLPVASPKTAAAPALSSKKSGWTPEARAKLSASLKKAFAKKRAATRAKAGKQEA